ncbi:anti-sigma factor family protein [Corynebacterium timonense]|uniref:Putative zinc-finger n=1 Tax=Corynebacterium timonense TaxID=441500 RepID=A0A1H1QCZ5_9CORY|nr:zf-HC2 domain-containing protein [Corynebacterium timonense]SDS21411.1 Putative zinc-finger [Corynebacterium timonense]
MAEQTGASAGGAGQPRFFSTEHLSTEAIAAFADGELSPSAERRAHAHIAECAECRRDIDIQRAAAARLRTCRGDETLRAPRTLVERLSHVSELEPDDETQRDTSRGAEIVNDVVGAALRALRRHG